MNDVWLDLAVAAPWLTRRVPRVPGPVSGLGCRATRAGGLLFEWFPAPARARVDGYRIERTRNGRAYEHIGDTEEESFWLPPVSFDEGWFYRVSAFNARGQGPAAWMYFHLRRRRDSILQLVPVRPGLRVNICEMIPATAR